MCGIAGFFTTDSSVPENAAEILGKMRRVMVHRGPDDEGEFLSGCCGFAFRRLSIIDLVGGRQPMFSPSGNAVLVFNGEIYNFRELRAELESKGAIFRTSSDTEVISVGYEYWGIDLLLSKLRGMFAIAIHDIPERRLILVRDHTGIKPLYYSTCGQFLLFASEVKAILEFPGMKAEINEPALPKYMSFLWVPAPETLFRSIFMLEPGHMLSVDEKGTRKVRYWNPDLITRNDSASEEEWTEKIDGWLARSVKEQMVSDVPLGALFSGGLDSSTVVQYMNRFSSSRVTTYTTGFSRQDLSEDIIGSDIESARVAAKHLGVDYHELILDPDVVNLLPKLVWHMDEPVADPAAITTYLICRAAKERCTVLLSGVGGDEIFGGYPRYLASMLAEQYRIIPSLVRKALVDSWAMRIETGSSPFVRNLKKFLRNADKSFEDRYLGYLTYYSAAGLRNLLIPDFDWEGIFTAHREIFHQITARDNLQTLMNLDLKTFLPNLNLLYTDKMSSAASVEVRVPILDHELIENASRIPGRLKIRRGTRKYILKKTAERFLPREIVWRKKAGFGAPIGAWLKGKAKGMMLDLLSEETVKRRGYFNPSAISAIVKDHLSGRDYNANQLWQLMTFELWHQTFIDG